MAHSAFADIEGCQTQIWCMPSSKMVSERVGFNVPVDT